MGRKFAMTSGLSPGFLRMGVTAASLSDWGTEPELKEELMMCVMSWGDSWETVLNKSGWDGVQNTGGAFHSDHEVG